MVAQELCKLKPIWTGPSGASALWPPGENRGATSLQDHSLKQPENAE